MPGIEPLAWGANEFTVFFDCDPYQVSTTRQKVSQAVEQEKPAHTKANYAPVFPRMRVGVQSLSVSIPGSAEYTPLLLGTTGILDYDSILSCSTTETHLLAQHATLRPQVDREHSTSVKEQRMPTSTAVPTPPPRAQENTCSAVRHSRPFAATATTAESCSPSATSETSSVMASTKMRLHTLALHGWGVVCGLVVKPHPVLSGKTPGGVRGLAIDDCGREIRLLC